MTACTAGCLEAWGSPGQPGRLSDNHRNLRNVAGPVPPSRTRCNVSKSVPRVFIQQHCLHRATSVLKSLAQLHITLSSTVCDVHGALHPYPPPRPMMLQRECKAAVIHLAKDGMLDPRLLGKPGRMGSRFSLQPVKPNHQTPHITAATRPPCVKQCCCLAGHLHTQLALLQPSGHLHTQHYSHHCRSLQRATVACR